ncbi:MAG: hypothetical protein HY841_13820 [Bacteroidetes bacterium]|nr:hypothetical protein [Bacteroidota bacterium]
MNKDIVENIIGNKFKNIIEVPHHKILKAEYQPDKKTAAVFYFDYDETLPKDLNEYQEKYLVSDYYNNPSYLQWNYYLIFLRDAYDPVSKKIIEQNDILTRKYLFKPEEFKKFFEYKKTEKEVQKNIVVDWVKKLNSVDLNEVYNAEPYTEAIDRFVNEKVLKEEEYVQPEKQNSQGLHLNYINEIKLTDNYRQYPIGERNYVFGKVNLIDGVNGVGKTSLLEAIEMLLCGKSIRNPAYNETAGSIRGFYNLERVEDEYSPSDNAKYRERDLLWYENDYSRGNQLQESFGRYNFYYSDAAFNFQNNTDSNAIIKYLSRIALGSEFGRIKGRLNGFKDRLNPIHRDYFAQIENNKLQIQNAEKTINEEKQNLNIEESYKTFVTVCKDYKWNKEIPKFSLLNISEIEKEIVEVQNLLNSLLQLLPAYKLVCLKDWIVEKERIELLEQEFSAAFNSFEIMLKEKNKIIETKAPIDLKYQLLLESEKYFAHPEYFKVDGLRVKIDERAKQINTLNAIIEQLVKIDKSIFENEARTLQEYKANYLNELNKCKEDKAKIELEIISSKEKLNFIQNIIVEIKAKGRDYLHHDNELTDCPLCETHFASHDELFQRINRAVSELADSMKLEKLNQSLTNTTQIIISTEYLLNQVLLIEKITAFQYKANRGADSLKIIMKNINSDIENLEKCKNDYDNLVNLKAVMSNDGVNEDSFKQLKNRITEIFPEMKFIPEDITLQSNYKILLENDANKINEEIAILTSKIESLNEKLKSYVTTLESRPNYSEFHLHLSERKSIIEFAIKCFNEIKQYLELTPEEKIMEISLKIQNISSLLLNIKNDQALLTQYKLAEQIKSVALKANEGLIPKTIRLKNALDVIGEILEKDSEEKVLTDFIAKNLSEIQDVFSNIHSPYEFKDVVFRDGKVYLNLLSGETDRPITKISSGQRSALALSIFLSLNKKINKAPNILLFDDPVTYTDDMNILSFLDYLREIVINENRQIIFATANKKLAGLFERKFAFLDEGDFKKIPLTR